MYKIPAKTLFIGKNLIYVPECHSTNDLAARIINQPSGLDGTIIVTDKQIKGRGQRGNQWLSEPGMNLTFSIILKPTFISPRDQFFLTRVISLAIHDLLKALIEWSAFIKWPNDLMVNDKKICGILIENQLRGNEIIHTIVGIGLNVNQENFNLSSATSLALITSKQFHLPSLLEALLENIEARYLALRNGKLKALENAYLDAMYWRNELHTFSSNEELFQGSIIGLDPIGKLLIYVNGTVRSFDAKEIVYVS